MLPFFTANVWTGTAFCFQVCFGEFSVLRFIYISSCFFTFFTKGNNFHDIRCVFFDDVASMKELAPLEALTVDFNSCLDSLLSLYYL